VILCPHGVLGPQDIQLDNPVRNEEAGPFRTRKAKVIAQFECAYLRDLLREHRGNISRAAAAAGKNRRAFWALMRKHQITVQPHNA
jgi:DNA-binding NtrC family response regulator